MFFPRLRRQAKWAFALLILVFAGSFVFLGVGSGGLDLGSLLQGCAAHSTTGRSIDKAQKKVDERPRDAAAQKELALAYEDHGRTVEAIATWQQYVALRPKDTEWLSHLASLQAAQADRYLQEAQIAFFQQTQANARATFGAAPTSKLGRALGDDPIASAVQTKATASAQQANSQFQSAATATVATYKKLADADPSSENLQLLGQTALRFQDVETAITAYKRALKATQDPTVKANIRAQLKSLQQQRVPPGGGG